MKIDVTTTDHLGRDFLELTINGRVLSVRSDVKLDDSTDEAIAAFFAGYAVGTADVMAALAEAEHDHTHD